MPAIFDRRKTLTQLENEDWGEPDGETSLVKECCRLRKVPLNEFSPENLRLMIGQQISLFFLVPLALEVLESEPLIDCRNYTGDLLACAIRVPQSYWSLHSDMRDRMRTVVANAWRQLDSMDADLTRIIREELSDVPDVLRIQGECR